MRKTKLSYLKVFVFVLILVSFSRLFSADGAPVKAVLERISKEIDTAVKDWYFSGNGREWKKDWPRTVLTREKFLLRTTLKGRENFAGTRVLNSPLYLKLQCYAVGQAEVSVEVDGKLADTFVVDGPPGAGLEMDKEVLIAKNLAVKDYVVVLNVKNMGFKPQRKDYWPARVSKPKEEGIIFRLNGAGISYPRAKEFQVEVEHWLLSMINAYWLINPDLRRFTFTGKPFDIADNRKTPVKKLLELNRVLEQAVQAFNMAALKAGDKKSLDASIQRSYRMAGELRDYAKEFKVYLIGNAHIDIAWLWRIYETVMVARNTYDTVIKNMDEYPELRYGQSQALTYDWIEKRDPDLFEKIKKEFQKGRWEIVGGMWVEPDCNLISGESWVRQILYGKNYFKEKFGVDVKTGWNVDSFGYNWNMPQFYLKSGIDRFVTQKIWWNDTTVFPYYIFWWEGVDGSRLLSYFPPDSYTSRVMLPRLADNITKYEATTGYKKSLVLYGLGDHGGGPNREILNRVRDYQGLYIAPDFIHSPSRGFLEKLDTDLGNDIPVWRDELYLEYHRGTFTTQAKIKKGNREAEALLASTEKLASITGMMGNTYPAAELEEAWKTVLTNQFHDILPGSSITPVYQDALEAYQQVRTQLKRIEKRALQFLAAKIDTSAIKIGVPLVVFNPLSFERGDFVTVDYPLAPNMTVKLQDTQGNDIPVEIARGEDDEMARISFVTPQIPALGYRVLTLTPVRISREFPPMKVSGGVLENDFYRLEINRKTGNISSIYDKFRKRECLEPGKEGNRLQVYEDLPEDWDAWNIGYTGRMWEINQADAVETVIESPVRAVLKVKKSFLGLTKGRYAPTEDFPSSFFTQYITLYRGLDRIDIRTEADWWEDHMMLKAAFPLGVTNDFASYEIPFAAIKRTTRFQTLWEKARHEVPALKWVDLSEDKWGFSLLNDGKYGYDIHGNMLKISLLRSPTWPDPMADRGKHTFVYSIYVHRGRWHEARTVERGAELNMPVIAFFSERHKGTLPQESSFFSLASPGVILESIKKEEKGAGFILRLYESRGLNQQAVLKLFKVPTRVYETDLMENNLREIAPTGQKITLDFKKFEIKTLKVYLE